MHAIACIHQEREPFNPQFRSGGWSFWRFSLRRQRHKWNYNKKTKCMPNRQCHKLWLTEIQNTWWWLIFHHHIMHKFFKIIAADWNLSFLVCRVSAHNMSNHTVKALWRDNPLCMQLVPSSSPHVEVHWLWLVGCVLASDRPCLAPVLLLLQPLSAPAPSPCSTTILY